MASGHDRERKWVAALPKDRPIYDRANYQMALMQDVRENKPELRYLFIKHGNIKDYRFIRQGFETIKTPLGNLQTIKLQRKGDKRGTTIWLAPSLDYVPVKIELIEKDGTRYSLLLKKLELNTSGSPS